MGLKYFTIGMAGHIDHGKTSLTKALTNVETDRLKEEKERNISIELGYAPLELPDGIQASIIDVPGHERFIRQMIAGVAGIDLVLLVIAADEGIMPQTKEHMEILSFLGIKNGMVVISKMDRVDEEFLELVTDDIKESLSNTIFEHNPILYVDSLSGKGIDELKEKVSSYLLHIDERDANGPFRLPIDQVFTVQGQGTIVRGTVYEGVIREGDSLTILPAGKNVRVRQMQVHHKEVSEARAGQRAAINISGVPREEIERGDVLVSSTQFAVTSTIDVCLKTVDELSSPLKQRSPIKLHIGTAEIFGKIVFFDRNELSEDKEEILCQLRLNEPIVAKRGDRFILRRPTPMETIAGGWVIDPNGQKYRFGEETIETLNRKKEGTPMERIIDLLRQKKRMTVKEIGKEVSLTDQEFLDTIKESEEVVEVGPTFYALREDIDTLKQELEGVLTEFHQKYSLRLGMNKAELIQSRKKYPKELAEFSLAELMADEIVRKSDQYIQLSSFQPSFPSKWSSNMKEVINQIQRDGMEVKSWEEYIKDNKIPSEVGLELKHYLLVLKEVYELTDDLYIHKDTLQVARKSLQEKTADGFTLKEAKETLGLSRKYLIPFLELLDKLHYTRRENDSRKWVV